MRAVSLPVANADRARVTLSVALERNQYLAGPRLDKFDRPGLDQPVEAKL